MSGAFHEIDADGDGHITLSELTSYLQKKGSSKSASEIQNLFKEADKNGDGKIDAGEFASIASKVS